MLETLLGFSTNAVPMSTGPTMRPTNPNIMAQSQIPRPFLSLLVLLMGGSEAGCAREKEGKGEKEEEKLQSSLVSKLTRS